MKPLPVGLPVIAAFTALVGLTTGACERGCLTTWLSERGFGERTSSSPRPARGTDLSGVDCSDGLLRCIEGRVEASRAAHLPYPCGGTSQGERAAGCTCPYATVLTCESGCAEEGIEVIGPASDAGATQLCHLSKFAPPVARPVMPGDAVDVAVCDDEGVRCVDGFVRVCTRRGQPWQSVARCLYGCQSLIAMDGTDIDHRGTTPDHGAAANPDGLSSILCRRDDAERR